MVRNEGISNQQDIVDMLKAGVPAINTEQLSNELHIDPADDVVSRVNGASAGTKIILIKGDHNVPVGEMLKLQNDNMWLDAQRGAKLIPQGDLNPVKIGHETDSGKMPNHVKVSNIYFDCSNQSNITTDANTSENGEAVSVRGENSRNIIICDNYIYKTGNDAIYFEGYENWALRNYCEECRPYHADIHQHMGGGISNNPGLIAHNVSKNSAGEGIRHGYYIMGNVILNPSEQGIIPGKANEPIPVIGNYVEGAGVTGIGGFQPMIAVGNKVLNCALGIDVSSTSGVDSLVSNNVVEGTTTDPAIRISEISKVQNNFIIDTANHGILINNNAHNSQIIGNLIDGVDYTGIASTGNGADRVLCANNSILNVSRASSGAYDGVSVAAGSDWLIKGNITYNSIAENPDFGINDRGNKVYIIDNLVLAPSAGLRINTDNSASIKRGNMPPGQEVNAWHSAPTHAIGKVVLADPDWDPDADGNGEWVMSDGTAWQEVVDLPNYI